MKNTADELRAIVEKTLPALLQIDESSAGIRPAPEKWSKKEILGHLIDSACNNQQKFVRTMADSGLSFVGYQQEHWVRSQHYQGRDWKELVSFWDTFNRHLAHIIENADPSKLDNTVMIETSGPFKLEFIMKDYLEHMKHHLMQILPGEPISSSFENIYNT